MSPGTCCASRVKPRDALIRFFSLLLMCVAALAAIIAPPTAAYAEKITDVYSNGILSGGLGYPFYVYLNQGETLYARIEWTPTGKPRQNMLGDVKDPQGNSIKSSASGQNTWTATESGVYQVVPSQRLEGDKNTTADDKFQVDWEITARSSNNIDIPGRVWTYEFAMAHYTYPNGDYFHGGIEGKETDLKFYCLNDTGYIYELQMFDYNGMESGIAPNALGNRDPSDPGLPAYGTRMAYSPASIDNGAYRLYFAEPADDLPATALCDGREITVAPEPLTIDLIEESVGDSMVFTPSSAVNKAGTFSWNMTERYSGHYVLQIDANNNGKFDDPEDVTIDQFADGSGSYSQEFDGKDGQGNFIGANETINARLYYIRLGEIHVISYDVEQRGGIALNRLNGDEAGWCPIHWDDKKYSQEGDSPYKENFSSAFAEPTSSSPEDGVVGNDTTAKNVHGWAFNGGAGADNIVGPNNIAVDDWTYEVADVSVGQKEFPGSAPSVQIEKSAAVTTQADPDVLQAGDIVTFTFTVTNNGTMPLTALDITDAMQGISEPQWGTWPTAEGKLAPGESVTATATYMLTQADIDNGTLENTATIDGQPDYPDGDQVPVKDNDTETVTIEAKPQIALEKSVDTSAFSAPVKPGDVATYTFKVTNAGNVTLADIGVADPMTGLSALAWTWPGTEGVLAPGESATATATYTVTQADIDDAAKEAGDVLAKPNSATAQGTPPATADEPNPQPVTGADDATFDVSAAPKVDAVKEVTATSWADGEAPAVGDTISYKITVTNTGNTTLTGVEIEDEKLPSLAVEDAAWPDAGAPGTLLPGQSVSAAGEYTLTQADLDAEHVYNVALVTGTEPGGGDVETPDDPDNPETPDTDTPLEHEPGLSIEKTADAQGIGDPVEPGDAITYTFTITNTGNVTLTGVTVNDQLEGLSQITFGAWPTPGDPGTLKSGESVTATAVYHVTQVDIDAGRVANSATATGTPPATAAEPDPEPITSDPSETDTPLEAAGALTIVKTADVSAVSAPAQVGEVITYHFTVKNTGNVTLSGVAITDQMAGLSEISYTWPGDDGVLAPGESATATATYALTQEDIDRGSVENTALATGEEPGGGDVETPEEPTTDPDDPDPNDPDPNDPDETVDLEQQPAISLDKQADVTAVSDPAQPGDTVRYTFTVKNTGNVTLTGVGIDDSLDGLGTLTWTWPGEAGVLEPGQTATAQASYALTQADIDAGSVLNTATATGTPAGGDPVTSTDTAEADVPQDPSIVVTKRVTATSRPAGEAAQPSDTISYEIVAKNDGNVTLTGVEISDPLLGGALEAVWPGEAGVLAPGESATATGTYTVTQADIDAGHVKNIATATGTDPSGDPVVGESGTNVDNPDLPGNETDTPLGQDPAIALEKSVDVEGGVLEARPGDTVTYTFKVTNTGNVTLTGVGVDDPMAGLSELVWTWPGEAGVLAPGESATATATYTVTQADIDAGSIENTAIATGTTPGDGENPSDSSTVTVEVEPAPEPAPGPTPEPQPETQAKPKLPTTGDPTIVGMLVAGVGAASCGAAYVLRRRR